MNTAAMKRAQDRRSGTILVLSAILMVVMMGFIAMSVDVGYMYNVQTELDRAVDAGALAGASALPNGVADCEMAARTIVAMNQVGKSSLSGDNVTVTPGHWNADSRVFTPDSSAPSAVKVTAQRDDAPLFFAPIWGADDFGVDASAIALFEPRDIMVTLDYSASMNDDSEYRNISSGLSQATIEANQAQMYAELGSPTYGTLQLQPTWMNVPGNPPTNSHRPQIHVEHRYDRVFIRSTKPFSRVKVYRSSYSYKSFYNTGTYNAADGVYELELTYDNYRRVAKVKVRSGYWSSNHSSSNRYEETFDFTTVSAVRNAAKKAFELNSVSYPYPGGSWDNFIDYCTDMYNTDSRNANQNAGYKYKFGYLNWINYLCERQYSKNATPDLWQTSQQPITAVKNSVDVFLAYMQSMNGGDRIGLAAYNGSDGWGRLEQPLTTNFGVISNISRERQAGHFHAMTNIAAGLDKARAELENNGRANVVKRIVLMTDGVPTYPGSSSNSRNLAIQAAHDCATAKIPVCTISLGSGADTVLMQEIANITDGIHFQVPGGRPISEIEEDLRDTFGWVATSRPLRLVKGD